MKKILLTFLLGSFIFSVVAQSLHRTCGTFAHTQKMYALYPESKAIHNQIEQFTEDYIKKESTQKNTRGTVYKIPVVVHVIHNGEAVGSGTNISAQQVNSQITVLNNDFRKLNPDWNYTPAAFKSLVADCEIEFCLAIHKPDGSSTTGIDRYNGGQASWTDINFDNTIKPATSWDNSKYLNIWVCKFATSMGGTLGYTTLPNSGWPANQDGVVIGYNYFGTVGPVFPPLNKGRTATHEVGHYFNLDHVWGDDNGACPGDTLYQDDNVMDTPIQADKHYGTPTFPTISCNNGPNGDMFMNYMDYVDDPAMYMFTAGQKTRMQAAINGPRASLKSSFACYPTGINEVKYNSELISVFPNPSTSIFYVTSNDGSFNSDFKFQLYNAIGQEVSVSTMLTKESESRYMVNASNLPNGTYFVKVLSNTKLISKTISIIK